MTGRRIDDLDVPLSRLQADIRALVTRQRAHAAAADADFARSIASGLTESYADFCARTGGPYTPGSSR
ncbi:hypothetical protein OG393_30780 [Streptomyces sp. NBC_01216]|uniref:hypothetical protein n=1 Tax=Streptomyces sp. NBC_01216 TaxID=2903778 RepID=UPI002E0FA0DC|nr:hypothetical protein OG393_30780 [Streptomyces sp. NBC_01216]